MFLWQGEMLRPREKVFMTIGVTIRKLDFCISGEGDVVRVSIGVDEIIYPCGVGMNWRTTMLRWMKTYLRF